MKARDQGSYSGREASFDGAVIIKNGTIDGTSVGIRVGEPNKADPDANVTGPNVTVTNVEVVDALTADADTPRSPR